MPVAPYWNQHTPVLHPDHFHIYSAEDRVFVQAYYATFHRSMVTSINAPRLFRAMAHYFGGCLLIRGPLSPIDMVRFRSHILRLYGEPFWKLIGTECEPPSEPDYFFGHESSADFFFIQFYLAVAFGAHTLGCFSHEQEAFAKASRIAQRLVHVTHLGSLVGLNLLVIFHKFTSDTNSAFMPVYMAAVKHMLSEVVVPERIAYSLFHACLCSAYPGGDLLGVNHFPNGDIDVQVLTASVSMLSLIQSKSESSPVPPLLRLPPVRCTDLSARTSISFSDRLTARERLMPLLRLMFFPPTSSLFTYQQVRLLLALIHHMEQSKQGPSEPLPQQQMQMQMGTVVKRRVRLEFSDSFPAFARLSLYLFSAHSPYSPIRNATRAPCLFVPDDPDWPKQQMFDDAAALSSLSREPGASVYLPIGLMLSTAVIIQAFQHDFIRLAQNLNALRQSGQVWSLSRRSLRTLENFLSGPVLLSLMPPIISTPSPPPPRVLVEEVEETVQGHTQARGISASSPSSSPHTSTPPPIGSSAVKLAAHCPTIASDDVPAAAVVVSTRLATSIATRASIAVPSAAHTQSHAHAHTQSHAHSHTQSHAHSHTQSHAHSHTQSHAHLHTQSHAHSHTYTHTHADVHVHASAPVAAIPYAGPFTVPSSSSSSFSFDQHFFSSPLSTSAATYTMEATLSATNNANSTDYERALKRAHMSMSPPPLSSPNDDFSLASLSSFPSVSVPAYAHSPSSTSEFDVLTGLSSEVFATPAAASM